MITKEFKFENGDAVIEKVTGFQGTITGTCFYLTGCTQYLITAKSNENKEPFAAWYDEGRLKLIGKSISSEDVKSNADGCDIPPTIGVRGN